MRMLLSSVLAIVLVIPCSASEIKTQKNILYPPSSSVIIQEEFASGTTASGNIGSNGFGVTAGTLTGIASISNRPGIYRLDTTAVLGTVAQIFLYSGSSEAIQSTVPHEIVWITRLNNNDADTTVRIGGMNSVATNPPNNGIYFEKLTADTNWFCIARIGGVETRTDSGVAVNINFTTFLYLRNSSGVQYKINNVNVCGTISTNLPSALVVPAVQIVNSAAASKTIDMDYFQIKYTGITR